jgi:hypothetical protein
MVIYIEETVMFEVEKIWVNGRKEWYELQGINDVPITNSTIEELSEDYYDCLINYFETVADTKQIPLAKLLAYRDRILDSNDPLYLDYTVGERATISSAIAIDALVEALKAIPSEPFRSLYKPKFIRYKDLLDYGYSLDNGMATDTGTIEDMVVMTNEAIVTPLENKDNLLYVINGRVFPATFEGDYAILKKGIPMFNYMDRNQIGIIDFTDFGGFSLETVVNNRYEILSINNIESKIKFKPEKSMFNYYYNDTKLVDMGLLRKGNYYYQKIVGLNTYQNNIKSIHGNALDLYAEINNVETLIATAEQLNQVVIKQDKTAFVITHGYLHPLTTIFYQNDNTIYLTLNHSKIVNLGMSPAEEKDWVEYPVTIDNSIFTVDNINISKYLTMNDSFILFVDIPNICIKEEHLEFGGFACNWLHYRVPQGLMYHHSGAFVHYRIADYDFNRVLIQTTDDYVNNRLSDTTKQDTLLVYDKRSNPMSNLCMGVVSFDYYDI